MLLLRSSLVLLSMLLCVGNSFAVDNSQSLFNSTDISYDGEAEGVNLIDTANQKEDALINVVKSAVNWVLGILGLIALIIVMYGGFLMVTSAGNDDTYGKGFTILKYAAIGLLLIGVAWFVISMVFRLVQRTTESAGGANSDQ